MVTPICLALNPLWRAVKMHSFHDGLSVNPLIVTPDVVSEEHNTRMMMSLVCTEGGR